MLTSRQQAGTTITRKWEGIAAQCSRFARLPVGSVSATPVVTGGNLNHSPFRFRVVIINRDMKRNT
jgi:hypothetical protein